MRVAAAGGVRESVRARVERSIAANERRAVLVGTDAGALTRPSATVGAPARADRDGAAREDRATRVSKEGDVAEDDAAVEGMGASGSSSVPSLAPFEELPRWAAAGAAREREKREAEKMANLAKRSNAPGSKWAAKQPPGGYAPKIEGLSASVLDHGDVDVVVNDDDLNDLNHRPDKENEDFNEENAKDARAPSVVSLKPLDDDDDALYYAESEPGGGGAEHSAPGAFGVVRDVAEKEGFSGGSDVATDETVDETSRRGDRAGA